MPSSATESYTLIRNNSRLATAKNQPDEICSHLSEKASKGNSYLEIKLFDEKGPLGDNVTKNLARNIYLISP